MSDGGYDAPVYGACEEYRDAGLAVPVDGGWVLPDARMALVKCRLTSCEAAREANGAPADVGPPVPLGIALGLTAALVAGFVLGAVVVGLRR